MKIDRDCITNKPKCYIFDLDGCIANSNGIILSKADTYKLKLEKYNRDLEDYNSNKSLFYEKLEQYNQGKIDFIPAKPTPPTPLNPSDEEDYSSFDVDYFYDNLDQAIPIGGIIDLFVSLSQNYKVIIVTGRDEAVRSKTISWLKEVIESRYNKDVWRRCNFTLIMRPSKNTYPSGKYKEQVFQDLYKQYNIQLVIDDHPDVLAVVDKLGLLSLKPNTIFKQIGDNDLLKS